MASSAKEVHDEAWARPSMEVRPGVGRVLGRGCAAMASERAVGDTPWFKAMVGEAWCKARVCLD